MSRKSAFVVLPAHITVAEARRVDVSACLSTEERAMFDVVRAGGSVFACGKCGERCRAENDMAVVSRVHGRGRDDDAFVTGGGRAARRMVSAGWFRFASMTNENCGYFWLTDAAERVHTYANHGKGIVR